MTENTITKNQLLNVIQDWGLNKISIETFQIWMLDNFEPEEFKIGEGESEHTIEAMHIVMNEYELAKPAKCLVEQYQRALNYINCNENEYAQAKHDFLYLAFCD